jgi:hypothetical protein
MELRGVRLEMSRPGGVMLKLDEVLLALIGSWRESRNQVGVDLAAVREAVVPVSAPPRVSRPRKAPTAAAVAQERQRDAREDAAPAAVVKPPPKFYRCPHPGKRSAGGFCGECDVKVAPGGGLPAGYVPPWAEK